MRGFAQTCQIGIALPLAVMNRIRRQIGGSRVRAVAASDYRACCIDSRWLGRSVYSRGSGGWSSGAVCLDLRRCGWVQDTGLDTVQAPSQQGRQ